MVLLFRLLHLILALALVAGGLAAVPPAHAAGAPAMADAATAIDPPCHDVAGEPVPPAQHDDTAADCCAPADCGCDCLQHAPTHLLAREAAVGLSPARGWASPTFDSLPPAPRHALTRPPIG